MRERSSSRTIVFDIGQVLVDLSFDRLFGFLRENGVRARDSVELAARLDYERYETGGMSDRDFHAGIANLADRPLTFDAWRAAWTGILTPNAPMLELADRLASRYDVCLLSNTNTLHFEHMERTMQLTERFRRVVTSFEAGAMKPDAAIYAYAERAFGRTGKTLVFFDDLEANVAAAQRAGWTAHRFTTREATIATLADEGFPID